ncbi:unnamed protein product [Rotaria socialis]|uniref:Uncharacterized protein n=2 Tax=Rotaria socialis TaxID=392032 RepID=A0A820V0V6_9BILA|nr:unnamed protein product [Rotaria socialis]
MNAVFGCIISDYILIKSRWHSFNENAALCPHHHYYLCDGYTPAWYCTYKHCYSRQGLIHMGARAALLIGDVPILGYICSWHRDIFEKLMLTKNLQPILIPQYGLPAIWDCVEKVQPIKSEALLSDNSSNIVKNQQRYDDRPSYEMPTKTYTDHSNYPSVDNGINTSKIHLTLRTQQNGNSTEHDSSRKSHRAQC